MDGKILYLSEKNLIDNNLLTMTQVMGSIEKMFELMYQQDYVMGGMNQNSHGLMMYVEKGIQKNIYIAMPGHLGGLYNTTGIKFHGPNRYLPGKKMKQIIWFFYMMEMRENLRESYQQTY